jgi:hypothetical protein
MSASFENRADSPRAYTLDTSRSPLVIVRATEAVNDPAAIAAWYADMDAFLARGALRFAVRSAGAPSDATRRKRFMAFIRPKRALIQKLCVAHAGIVRNAVETGIFTAFLWPAGDEVYVPVKMFHSEPEATGWLLSQYRSSIG